MLQPMLQPMNRSVVEWRRPGQETAKGPFGLRVKLPPAHHTRRRLHTVPLIAERQAGNLCKPIIIVFGLTRPVIEPHSTSRSFFQKNFFFQEKNFFSQKQLFFQKKVPFPNNIFFYKKTFFFSKKFFFFQMTVFFLIKTFLKHKLFPTKQFYFD